MSCEFPLLVLHYAGFNLIVILAMYCLYRATTDDMEIFGSCTRGFYMCCLNVNFSVA